jgi:hypothetical protein
MDPEAKPHRSRRLTTALVFLGGVLTSLSALRDAKVLWPPDQVWAALQHPQQLELGSGMALIALALIFTVIRRSDR